MVRLMVEVFHAPKDTPSTLSPDLPVLSPGTRDVVFVNSAVSDIITNSKSKECGPLRLHDVNPACRLVYYFKNIFAN